MSRFKCITLTHQVIFSLLVAGSFIVGPSSVQSQTVIPPGPNGVWNGFRIEGEGIDDRLGNAIANAGDINGDGLSDIIVSAPYNDNDNGAAYIIYGSYTNFSALIDAAELNGTNGYKIVGPGNGLGGSVAGAGDINGDGLDDYIIDNQDWGDQKSYVVFGTTAVTPPSLDLSTLDGTNGVVFSSESPGADEYSVSGAGDVNGDGYGDILIGKPMGGRVLPPDPEFPEEGPLSDKAGFTYLVFGKSDWTTSATVDLSALSGVDGVSLVGAPGDFSGHSVSDAGDVNGDGFDDVLIGAYFEEVGSPFLTSKPNNYVLFGKDDWSSTSTINLADLDGTDGFRIVDDTDAWYGGVISSAGDVNRDGYSDILIAGHYGDLENLAYIIFGKADWGSQPTVNPVLRDGINGFRVTADNLFNEISAYRRVSEGGDINGDGYADLLIVCYASNADICGIYTIFGKADWTDTADLDWSSLNGENGYLVNETRARIVAGGGDVNGDGYSDFIYGIPSIDSANVAYGSGSLGATYRGVTPQGDSPEMVVGTADSRIRLDFDGGTSLSLETVHIIRSRDNILNLEPGESVGQTVWSVSSNRTGWGSVKINLKYLAADIENIPDGESNLHIYRSPSARGPWSAVDTTVDTGKNTVMGETDELGFFTIAGITPPAGFTRASWARY